MSCARARDTATTSVRRDDVSRREHRALRVDDVVVASDADRRRRVEGENRGERRRAHGWHVMHRDAVEIAGKRVGEDVDVMITGKPPGQLAHVAAVTQHAVVVVEDEGDLHVSNCTSVPA